MTAVQSVLDTLNAFGAAAGAAQFLQWMRGTWEGLRREGREGELRSMLEQLAGMSKIIVQRQVYQAFPDDPARQRQVFEQLLQLRDRVRTASIDGSLRSSWVRLRPDLERLLEGLDLQHRAGDRLSADQDWVLDQYLGSGAFGEVWRGHNPNYGYRAFKFVTHEDAKRWVRREARTLVQLHERLGSHPHLVTFHDVNVESTRTPYLAFEYVGGPTLLDHVLEESDRRLSVCADRVIAELCSVLSVAHRLGISHRDLKLSNVLLTLDSEPRAKLTDFGLADFSRPLDESMSLMSSSQAIVGTLPYLPPEALDPTAISSDTQQDVFALGVIWYQLCTMRLERPPYDFATRLRAGGCDPVTIAMITRCLASPGVRFTDALALQETLQQNELPRWQPPAGCFDVDPIMREFLSRALLEPEH